ncbi:uncharacterized protein TM35_000261140 [Trypanosoma theileri]|uniref:Uncharacterized protein n=1 Tax=Trypanosoma theileri TaxID=67003 RepID=A0A1X0NPL6_9TRYP|nr:uncharacterized protein TM35_000261140 [Trypanosoma theileri]ORC86662.1 hypothetical protein TM35_000261140 [Trypanosoma theileri]
MQYCIILFLNFITIILIAADVSIFLPITVVSAEPQYTVPIQSEFTAYISGDQWRRVIYRLSIQSSNNDHSDNNTIYKRNGTHCINNKSNSQTLVGDTFHCILISALHPFPDTNAYPSPTGIISIFLTQITTPIIITPLMPMGLYLYFAVVRMMGNGSIAPNDDSLIAQLIRTDINPLREIYYANGGLPTDTVALQSVKTADNGPSRERFCGPSCLWSVIIIIPLFVTTLLLLLVCISVIGTANDAGRSQQQQQQKEQQREEYVIVAYTPEAELDEFINCEDWGPVTLVDPDFLQK